MPSTVRFNQRLSAWFLVLGNEDREAFLGGLKILELACPLDVIAGRESHPFTDALGSDFNVAADVASDVHKDESDKLRVFLRIEGGPVLLLISASIDMGTCAPVGVGTSTRLREIEVIPEIARVAHVDWISLAPFDGHSWTSAFSMFFGHFFGE